MNGFFSDRVLELKRRDYDGYLMFLDYVMNPNHRKRYNVVVTKTRIDIKLK